MRRLAVVVVAVVVVCLGAFLLVSRPADPAPPPSARPAGAPADLAPGEMWLADMELGSADVLTADGRLRDVRISARDVVLGGADGLRAGEMDVEAVVPFEVVAEQVGSGTAIAAAPRGQARVTRTVTLVGRSVDLSATGTVRAENGQVAMVPTSVDVGGPGWLADAVGDVAARFVTIRHDVEGLPPDLTLDDVAVTGDGFAVQLSGTDVVLGGTGR